MMFLKINFFQLITFFMLVFFYDNQTIENSNIFVTSDDKIIIVTKDKIHLFRNDMFEIKNTKIFFNNQKKDHDKNNNIFIDQFIEQDGKYIIIIVINKILIFRDDGTLINSQYFHDSINKNEYSLITYKRANNYLYFLLSFTPKYKNEFILKYFKININLLSSNKVIITKKIKIESYSKNQQLLFISKINCIFMFHLGLNQNLLVCFYIIFPLMKIQMRSFDPTNNFDELAQLSKYLLINNIKVNYTNFIIGICNQNKSKAFLYFPFGTPFIITFDFENWFSRPIELINRNHNTKKFFKSKFIYNKKNNEFLFLYSKNYHLFITYYDSYFQIKKNERIILHDKQNFSLNSFYTFNNGTIFTLKSKNNKYELKILNRKNRNLEADINEKCRETTPESSLYNLCISCNTENGYYPAENFLNNTYNHSFIDCYNNQTKPINFYLNNSNVTDIKYKPCYETCLTCEREGNEYNHNCIICAKSHINRPDNPSNCVTNCTYYYYYTSYGQYKCSKSSVCPEEASLYIKEINKCTKNCSEEGDYHQYGGLCMTTCPSSTRLDPVTNICVEIDYNSCFKSENVIDIKSKQLNEIADAYAKTYSKEFLYTSKHVSYYYNDLYSILLYKEYNCIEELHINISKFDFGNFSNIVLDSLTPPTNYSITIAIIERKEDGKKPTSIAYFYHPETGDKIDVNPLCENNKVIIKNSILPQLNNSIIDRESIFALVGQEINIFNINDAFYTDICFHFLSPNGKDIPLKDRILSFYPNIVLCDEGCLNKGVNLTTMESICECKLNFILNNDLKGGKAFIEFKFGELTDFLSNSNLDILKCYKDIFKIKYIKKNFGSIMMILLIFIEIILSIIFWKKEINNIIIYLNYLLKYFAHSINNKNKDNNIKTKSQNDEGITINNLFKKNGTKNNITKEITIKTTEKKMIKRFKLSAKSINNKMQSNKNLSSIYKYKINKLRIKNRKSSNDVKDSSIKKFIKEKEKKLFKCKNEYRFNPEEYLKTEPDDMDFDDALKYDTRSFRQYFHDKFIENQILMDTFVNKENLKPMSIKILLFLLNINLYFLINGLLFSEDYISKLYHSNEKEKFFSFLYRAYKRCIYTTIVGAIIGLIIDCIFVEEKKVKRLFIREKKNIKNLYCEMALLMKKIKRNYIIFMIICFIISIFSWYYLSCFNNVYPGCKVEWIKSSFAIIIIFQILSLLSVFLVSLIRSISFKLKSERIYKLMRYFLKI